jgi:hypothetical protein
MRSYKHGVCSIIGAELQRAEETGIVLGVIYMLPKNATTESLSLNDFSINIVDLFGPPIHTR